MKIKVLLTDTKPAKFLSVIQRCPREFSSKKLSAKLYLPKSIVYFLQFHPALSALFRKKRVLVYMYKLILDRLGEVLLRGQAPFEGVWLPERELHSTVED